MNIEMETATPGQGRSGEYQSGSIEHLNITASPEKNQFDRVSETARELAATRARIAEVNVTVNTLFDTINEAKRMGRTCASKAGRDHFLQVTDKAALDIERLLKGKPGPLPHPVALLKKMLGWWNRAAEARLDDLSIDAAFDLAIAAGDGPACERLGLAARPLYQRLDDYERHVYRETWPQ